MGVFSHGKVVTVLQYFTPMFQDYWHTIYPVTRRVDIANDRFSYFYDISSKAMSFSGRFNDEGIYLFPGYDGQDHIHSLEVAQYTLACWLSWRKTDDVFWLNKAILHSDWLRENQLDDGRWVISHVNPQYSDLGESWCSSLAQGLAISALIRAYEHTSDISYMDAALKAADFLERDFELGGLKRSIAFNDVEGFVYEEYPRDKVSGVLNGHISSVLAILELSHYEERFKISAEENIENLVNILPLYDIDYWSLYSLDGVISSGFYHRLVINQLDALSYYDKRFESYKAKFSSYANNLLFATKALINKIGSKI